MRQQLFGMKGQTGIQCQSIPDQRYELVRKRRTHEPDTPATRQQQGKRGKFARARDLPFFARLIKASL
jgi:hypothetical protein